MVSTDRFGRVEACGAKRRTYQAILGMAGICCRKEKWIDGVNPRPGNITVRSLKYRGMIVAPRLKKKAGTGFGELLDIVGLRV